MDERMYWYTYLLCQINGRPSGFFSSSRGIRLGDYLSPYIFVIVMEFFSIQMELATTVGVIKPIRRGGEKVISHLLFADDMLIFSKGNVETLRGIDEILEKMAQITGLAINKMKSRIYFSKGC